VAAAELCRRVQGPRLYDWALVAPARADHWLLGRRSLRPGEKGELELAFFRCWSPRPVVLPEPVAVATAIDLDALIDPAADAERIIGRRLASQALRAVPRTRTIQI
jgi:hypothetical protein